MRSLAGEALHRLPRGVHRQIPPGVRQDLRYRFGRYAPGDLEWRPVPSSTQIGEVVGPPDLVLLGNDSGARRLFEVLVGHPGSARPPDNTAASSYFSRFCLAGFTNDDAQQFYRWFPRVPGQLTVLWLGDGLAYPWIGPLLAAAAPAARIVVVVRDPVVRLFHGLENTVEQRAAHVGSYLADAFERGLFGSHVGRLVDLFGGGQVLVVQLEKLVKDPESELARLAAFAGLDPGTSQPFVSPLDGAPALSAVDPVVLDRLRSLYLPDVELLTKLVPDLDLSLWPSVLAR